MIYALSATLAALGVSTTADAHRSAPPAYRLSALATGVPPNVLFAVALQESGMELNGRLVPWPWTLNVAGLPYRFATRTQACIALTQALRTVSSKRVDVGLGQIDVGFHGHRVARPCDLLDPNLNLLLVGTILQEQHRPGEDWLIAVGKYHRPAGGQAARQYQRSVTQHLSRLLSADGESAPPRSRLP